MKSGHVAIDGAKIKANASKHKAVSHDRMNEAELRLREEVEELLRHVAEVDETEDAQYGEGPAWPDPEQAQPEAKAQRNFTDPDSRIMCAGGGGQPGAGGGCRRDHAGSQRQPAGHSIYKMRKAIVGSSLRSGAASHTSRAMGKLSRARPNPRSASVLRSQLTCTIGSHSSAAAIVFWTSHPPAASFPRRTWPVR